MEAEAGVATVTMTTDIAALADGVGSYMFDAEVYFRAGIASDTAKTGFDAAAKAISSWLRSQNQDEHQPVNDPYLEGVWNAYSGAATCIERGDFISLALRAHLEARAENNGVPPKPEGVSDLAYRMWLADGGESGLGGPENFEAEAHEDRM